MSESPVRVLVVDDQRLMRDGIASLLEIQDGVEVVGTAGSGQEAIEMAVSLRPDVVLMDVRMPGMDGVAATRQIRQQLPECKILMLTTFDDSEYVVAALHAGATGYLLKDIPAQDLARAVQAVHKGIYQLDPAVAGKIVASLGNPHAATTSPTPEPDLSKLTGLTAREIEVLRLIANGANNREIALRLTITEGTVKNHISNILSRLSLRDRTQAALYARKRVIVAKLVRAYATS